MTSFRPRALAAFLALAVSFQSVVPAPAAWNFWTQATPITSGGGGSGTVQAIQPSSAWAQTADSGNATPGQPAVSAIDPTAGGMPNGQRNITGVSSHGGLIQVTLDATANASVGEQWLVSGSGGIDGFWKVLPVDGTHLDLCADITGNEPSYTCSGSTYSSSMTASGTIAYPQKVVAAFDTPPFTWIEDANQIVCVAATTGNRAGITGVEFWFEGSSPAATVTQQTISPNGTRGFCVNPQSPAGKDGDAVLYARPYSPNGYDRVLRLPLTLNVNGTISRPTTYVNCSGGGSDSNPANGTSGAPYASIQKAMASVADGGRISVIVPATSVTFTTGTKTTVNAPGHQVIPGGRVTFNGGTLPTGIVADQPYYVLLDNFSANSFEISAQPNGLNTPADRDPDGNVVSFPVATSGPSSGVSMYGATCMDNYGAAGSPRYMNRSVSIQPDHLGAVTISRSLRAQVDGGGIVRPSWAAPLSRFELVGFTLDMLKEINFVPGGSGTSQRYITLRNVVMNRADGTNPPFGADSIDANYNGAPALLFGPLTTADPQGSAIIDSLMNTYSTTGATLVRNVEAWASYDTFSTGFGTSNSGIFNFKTHKHGRLLSRNTFLPTTTVASVPVNNGDGTWTFKIANYGGYIKDPKDATKWYRTADDWVVFYGIGDVTYRNIIAADITNEALTVAASDLSMVAVGTRILAGSQSHGDNFQITGYTSGCPNGVIMVDNLIMQRRYSFMDYPQFESFQGMLNQTQGCETTSGNDITISADGKTVTFATARSMVANNIITLPLSPTLGVTAGRVDPSFGTTPRTVTSVPLAYPFTGGARGTFSRYFISHLTKDVAITDSVWVTNGLCSYEGAGVNWIFQNSTILGCQIQLRDSAGNPPNLVPSRYYGENIVAVDTILTQYVKSGSIQPSGIFNDNLWATTAIQVGSNTTVGAISFGADYSPVGMTRKLRANQPVPNPWDYYGNPRVPGVSNIGAVN